MHVLRIVVELVFGASVNRELQYLEITQSPYCLTNDIYQFAGRLPALPL
jgi:hypothetical protein